MEDKVNQGNILSDIYMDKSAYQPGEQPVLTVEFNEKVNEMIQLEVKIKVRHMNELIDEILVESVNQRQEFTITVPEKDFIGYSVEIYVYDEKQLVDYDMTAIDVSSNWNKFPRYGYITKMESRSEDKTRIVLDRLKKHHINALFYYDVINAHDQPLAGSKENPADSWSTLAHTKAYLQTVIDTINIGHEYNMNSFIYNLIFGAYDDFLEKGIKKEWGLFKDKNHNSQDAHDLTGLSWETNKLWLFDPANPSWQDYYLTVHKELLEIYDYDGIQVDSLGGRGKLYDYDGNEVILSSRYASLLNRLGTELNTRVLFNPVSGYGMREQLRDVDYDVLYMEVWSGDHKTYSSLKIALDELYRSSKGEKGAIIAAYMNYDKGRYQGGSFNRAGVNYTNAALIAAGGSHLELGDTGMLCSEYYPGKSMQIDNALEKDLRNYYSYMVAYENILRGEGLRDYITKTYINEQLTSYDSRKGEIWSFTKIKEGEQLLEICHLINLIHAEHVEWADNSGDQTEPEILTELLVKHYSSFIPERVSTASPDYLEGILVEVPFEKGSDEKGDYITFTLPYLSYYTMFVME